MKDVFIARNAYSHDRFKGHDSVIHNEYEELLTNIPKNGILTPQGTFVSCEYGGHSQVVAKMIVDFSYYMEEDDVLAQSLKFSYDENSDEYNIEMDINCDGLNASQYVWVISNKGFLNEEQKDIMRELLLK